MNDTDDALREDLKRVIAKIEGLASERSAAPPKPYGEMTLAEKFEFLTDKYAADDFDPRTATDQEKLEYVERNGVAAFKSAVRRTQDSDD